MKRYIFPGIVLLAMIGFTFWWFSPTQALKRKTNNLLAALTMDADSGRVGRQTGAYSLNALLAEQVELDTPTIKEANGTFERNEMESAYGWLSNQAKQTRFELKTLHSIDITGDKAVVKLTLFGLVELPTYRPADGTYDVVFDWVKKEDGWRLTKATWTQKP